MSEQLGPGESSVITELGVSVTADDHFINFIRAQFPDPRHPERILTRYRYTIDEGLVVADIPTEALTLMGDGDVETGLELVMEKTKQIEFGGGYQGGRRSPILRDVIHPHFGGPEGYEAAVQAARTNPPPQQPPQ